MTSHRIAYTAALAAGFLFYITYVGWFSFYLLILLLVFPWFSLLLSLPWMLTFSLKVNSPRYVLRDSAGQLLLHVSAGSFLPCAHVRLRIGVNSLCGKERKIVDCFGFQHKKLSIPLYTEHCGIVSIEIGKIRLYDYLGIFSVPLRKREILSTTVLPCPIPPAQTPELPPTPESDGNLKAKPGGGYAENYELREYREGEPMKGVHWKLSSKLDKIILREPMIPEAPTLVITFDLPNDVDARDSLLDELRWCSDALLQLNLPHELRWFSDSSDRCAVLVSGEAALLAAFEQILMHTGSGTGITSRVLGGDADWQLHLSSGIAEVVK